MTLYIPAEFFQLSLVHRHIDTAKLAVMTCGWEHVSGSFPADAAALESSYISEILPIMSNQWRLEQVNYRTAGGTLRSASYAVAGGGTNTAMPPQVAYLLHKRTASPGRRNRGRMYMPGVFEVEVDSGGKVSTAILGELNTRFADWIAAAFDAHFQPCILHNTELPPTHITEIVCDPLVATQRRRLR